MINQLSVNILQKTGLSEIYNVEDFVPTDITLRSGVNSILWVNKYDNHGILDEQSWEDESFYCEDYRKESSAKLDQYTSPEEHLDIYERLNYRQFCQFVKYVTKDTKFLEIGCSFGGILRHMNNLHLKKCDAIEPNIEDATFVKQRYRKCHTINDALQNHDFGTQKYNLIVAFEVLEHICNLKEFIHKLSSILDKGGKVSFEVPNHNDALLTNYEVENYQSFYYRKVHIHYFTPESIKNIFGYFNIIGNVTGFQIYPFFNQVQWLYNNGPQSSAKEALTYPQINRDTSKINNDIYKFFLKTNDEYTQLVEGHLCSDSLIFQGILY